MKIIGLLLFNFYSCFILASDIQETLNGYMRAWNEHDTQKIISYFDQEASWYDLTRNVTITGKKQVSDNIIKAFMGSVNDMFWVKSADVIANDEVIVYEWIYGGIFNGKWGHQQIENKAFSINGISTTFINESGKITAQKDFYNLDQLKTALGVK